ncbi:MAG: fibronectin type III domain-containing protein [Firmicutes bacterium]|nr:fibronectin type III domain-containing protein [Bacillota bacterium]
MSTCERKHGRMMVFLLVLFVAVAFSMPEGADAASKKPGKVKGLKVTSTSYNSVSLNWKKPAKAKKYEVYRSTSRTGKYKKVKKTGSRSFKSSGLVTGQTYWYKVRAINGKRKGKFSAAVSAVPQLKKPGFTATSNAGGPKLVAGKVTGASGYIFYRDGQAIAKQAGTTFVDSAISEKSTHNYRTAAYRTQNGKTIVSPLSRTMPASKLSVAVDLVNCNTVNSLQAGGSFDLTGTIRSTSLIKRVEIGIVDKSTNKWVSGAKYDNGNVNAKEFNIANAKSAISFGALYGGVYSYRIYAHLEDGSLVTVLNHTFSVAAGTGAAAIASTAARLAWPYGTSSSKYAYPSGSATDAFNAAIQLAYGSRSGWGAQTKAGASCDVFVGTCIRASGYDTGFPRGLDGVESYCSKHPEKWRVTGLKSESGMVAGDVIYQIYSGGGGHILIYLGNNRVANAHYNGKTYGIIQTFSSQVKAASKCKKYIVYRAVQ